MTQVSNDLAITTNSLVLDDKVMVADPSNGDCIGCYFRKNGECHKPTEWKAWVCVSSVRSDFRDIIWKEKP